MTKWVDMKIGECRLGFIGFGHMAQILCKALLQGHLVPRSQVVFIRRDAHKMKQNEQAFGITSTSLERLVDQSDVLLLCVRPQQADEVLKEMARIGTSGKRVVSLLAGKKTGYLHQYLGSEAEIFRVMPNIASEVGEGLTLYCRGPAVSPDFASLVHLFFKSMGEAIEIPEGLMDAATALAGSGSGFALYLIEAMARAGEKEGFPYEDALRIAAQVFSGAAKLTGKKQTAELLQQIATPGGTTEAGLAVLKRGKAAELIQEALSSAAKKSAELAK